jgi:polysaccharide biosynthesis transport protein
LAQYDINLREYWRILKRRRWVVVLTAIVLGGLSTAFAVFKAPAPIYSSVCSIKFDKETTVEGLFARTLTWSGGDDIETQISIIKSYAVFQNVAERLGLIPQSEDSADNPSSARVIGVIDELQSKVEVTRQAQTNILHIKVKDHDPAFARKLANAIAATYRDLHSEKQMKRTTDAIKYIEEQLVQVRQKLKEAEEEFNRFTQDNQLLSIDVQGEKVLERTQEIQSEIRRITESRGELEGMVQRLDQFIANPSSSQAGFHLSSGTSQYHSANTTLTELQLKKDTLLKDYTPLHPEVVEAGRKIIENAKKMRIVLLSQIAELTKKDRDAKKDLQELERKSSALMEKKLEYDRLRRKVELHSDMTTLLERKNQEAQIRKAEKPEEVSIVKPALLPAEPINPLKTTPTGAMGLLIGLVLGMIAAFVVETFDTSLGAIEEVEETLKTSVWGMIPQADERELREVAEQNLPEGISEAASPHVISLVAHFAPKSMIAESFRALRTNVQGKGEESGVRAISITSASPQEGKTLVSVNLGVAMAQTGLKTLLVGSDMRKPSLGRVFGLEHSPGLSDVLLGNLEWRRAVKTISDIMVGAMTLEEVITTPGLDNIHIITSGAIPPNPAELMDSKRLRDFIEKAKKEYDFIVFDSPPILSTADAAILAAKMDGVLLVYRIGTVSRGLLKRATTQLEQVKSPLMGVVLNGVKPDISPDFEDFRYYKHYYSYGEGEEKGHPLKNLLLSKGTKGRKKRSFPGRSLGILAVPLVLVMGVGGFLRYGGDISFPGLMDRPNPQAREPVQQRVSKTPLPVPEKIRTSNQAAAALQAGPIANRIDRGIKVPSEQPASTSPATVYASIGPGTKEAPPSLEAEEATAPKKKPEVSEPTVARQKKIRPAPVTVQEVGQGEAAPYPYSLYLGSVKTLDMAERGAAEYEKEGLRPYWVKVNFVEKGVWYRIFVGQFRERHEAEAFALVKGLSKAKVFKTEYANLIGEYSGDSAAAGKKRKLLELACAPYTVPGSDGKVRLLVGAYVTKEGAEEFQADLRSLGVESRVVKR